MSIALRLAAPKLASTTAQSSVRSARSDFENLNKHKFSNNFSATSRSNNAFATIKRSPILKNTMFASVGKQSKRGYNSEMANAMVQVSQNLGMGQAAIGLGGASIGIGMVFASLLTAVARNPTMRGQLFTYTILGFAFVEAMGLFDLMIAMMCKYV